MAMAALKAPAANNATTKNPETMNVDDRKQSSIARLIGIPHFYGFGKMLFVGTS